jgi:predicted DCC family thiol-disulfide oxidoreductase YuxK
MEIEVFFDGDCPLCRREIELLRRLDRGRGRIAFTDIASPSFDVGAAGVPWQTLMDEIHGRLPDGTLVRGVEVFRRLYGAVGLGAVAWLTRLPGVRQLADAAYQAFARNRLRLTGRCADSSCKVPARG